MNSVNSLTFLYDTALIIQHALHLTASHVHQPGLIHKRLPAVKACAVEQVGPNRDQKANVVLPQPCKNKQRCEDMEGRKAVVALKFIKLILAASPALTCQIQMKRSIIVHFTSFSESISSLLAISLIYTGCLRALCLRLGYGRDMDIFIFKLLLT